MHYISEINRNGEKYYRLSNGRARYKIIKRVTVKAETDLKNLSGVYDFIGHYINFRVDESDQELYLKRLVKIQSGWRRKETIFTVSPGDEIFIFKRNRK